MAQSRLPCCVLKGFLMVCYSDMFETEFYFVSWFPRDAQLSPYWLPYFASSARIMNTISCVGDIDIGKWLVLL